MSSDIRAIVFDLDGVIRYWDPEIVAVAESSSGLPAGAIFGAAFEPMLLNGVITGAITDRSWREEVAAHLAAKHPHAHCDSAVAAWSGPHGELMVGAHGVLSAARRYGAVCLLTNATDRLSADLRKLGIESEFDHIFNSSDIGYAKPDARIFAHVEEQLGLPPDAILFFDDSATNVRAAIDCGWNAVCVQPGDNVGCLLAEKLGVGTNL